ncbi:hypothetical protein NBRC111894_937 [Sporolactobacillus inulinus]|uniref:Uncharacterized protein n=1 Tax=Sporolactobacillus inulinus TaxID=2078 RepID=A0A4Y1Z8L8_9BACL|nr:hypothetical protein NBRC111894_937 [Sporolactobacillus inulinus]
MGMPIESTLIRLFLQNQINFDLKKCAQKFCAQKRLPDSLAFAPVVTGSKRIEKQDML